MQSTADEQSLQVVTLSAYRAFEFALGGEPNWDFLAIETQMGWERLCRRAEAILLELEGQGYPAAAQRLYERYFIGDPPMPFETLSREVQLAWQAVTRHLMALIDGDNIEDLDGQERSWRGWVLKRLEPHP